MLRSMGRIGVAGALLLLLACCSAEEPPFALCPTLKRPFGSFSGVLLPPGSAEPGACVTVLVDGERAGRGRVTDDGSLAIQIASRQDLDEARLQIQLPTRTFDAVGAGPSEALIRYEAWVLPTSIDGGGRVSLSVTLASTDGSTPIEGVWLVDWSKDRVAPMRSVPVLDEPFTTTTDGTFGDRVAPASRHVSGGAGGCWWPAGGGGIVRCSDAAFVSGRCTHDGPTCTPGRGCTPIAVGERASRLGSPERSDEHIPVGPMPDAGRPFDAGVLEGGPS